MARHQYIGESEQTNYVFPSDAVPPRRGARPLTPPEVQQISSPVARPPTVVAGEGLQVCMRSIPDVTDPSMLPVPFYFQCPPLDSFKQSHSFNFTDYYTVSNGQLTTPTGVDLSTVSFASLFVDHDAMYTNLKSTNWRTPGTSGDSLWVPNPLDLTQELVAILKAGTPFELIIGQRELWGYDDVHWGPVNGNAATLRTLDVEERPGELDARYVNVAFTEYRSAAVLTREQKAAKGTRGRKLPTTVLVGRDGNARDAAGNLVVANATLSALARTFYGEPSKWRQIALANGITTWSSIRSLGEYVQVHSAEYVKLTIPALPKAPTNTNTNNYVFPSDAMVGVG